MMTKRRRKRPVGSVVQRASGQWFAVASVTVNGRRTRPRRGPYPTRAQAEDALTLLVADIVADRFVVPDRTLLDDYLASWLNSKRHDLKPSTMAGYVGIVSRYVTPTIGQTPLVDLRPVDIISVYNKMRDRGLTARTVRTLHVLLVAALKDAVAHGTLRSSPMQGVKAPRVVKRKMPVLTMDELRTLLDYARDHTDAATYVAIHLAATSGMRRGEVCGLRWEDVSLDRAEVTVARTRVLVGSTIVDGSPKTERSRRTIPIDPSTVTVLRAWKLEQRWSPDVVIVHPETLSERFDQLIIGAGVPRITFHQLRHGVATYMLAAGVPITTVSERLGHSLVSTTLDIYSHPQADDARDAADALGAAIFGNPTGA